MDSLRWTPVAIFPAFAGLMAITLVLLVWPQRHRAVARAFFCFMAATGVWALAYALELCATNLPTALFWANVEYFGIPGTPTAFLALVLIVARISKYRRLIWAFFGLHAFLVSLAAWTNDRFHLLRQNVQFQDRGSFYAVHFDLGPAYLFNLVVSYVSLIIGLGILARMAVGRSALSRKQGQVLLLGMSFPCIGNVARLAGYEPIPGFDQTPMLFVLSATIIAYGLFRWSLISVVPIARDAIVDGLRDPVIVLGPYGKIVDTNPAAATLFGLTAAEITESDLPSLERRFPGTPSFTTGDEVLNLADRSFILRRTALFSANQDPYGFILQFTDVTDQQLAEAELRRAKILAEETSAAKSRFVAHVSHELRTPLTGVVGLSDLMAKTELTAKQQEFLQGIRKSSQTLLRLINDVLDMSKLEAEAMPIVAEPTNVRELIAEVVLIHRPMALEKGIDLRFLEPDRDDLTLLLDPLRLHQILHNLVGNAVKFTLEGEVTIDFHRVSPTEFELVVRDTGIGIAPDKQSTVFEAFEQADATTTRFFGGTGLGLTITQRLVQRMGGTISLASERGVGTAITVRLALEEVEPVEETIQVRPVPPGIRVLLAEDNVVNTLVITEQLKDFGCIVTHGSNGRAAVAAFGEQSFDLVLMDIQMPEMDGYQACQAIRTQFPDRPTPIFALTANAFEDERSQAKKVGMNGYLTKPIQTDEIIPVLLLAANPPPALAS